MVWSLFVVAITSHLAIREDSMSSTCAPSYSVRYIEMSLPTVYCIPLTSVLQTTQCMVSISCVTASRLFS